MPLSLIVVIFALLLAMYMWSEDAIPYSARGSRRSRALGPAEELGRKLDGSALQPATAPRDRQVL